MEGKTVADITIHAEHTPNVTISAFDEDDEFYVLKINWGLGSSGIDIYFDTLEQIRELRRRLEEALMTVEEKGEGE